ncbi:MAG TPA: polyhydroxyalkanoate synthesis regulator DNA-binding domain-containing protein [Myxococcales bacterium]|nr:polyhydroxyalkanoate synthesis regulator DNA-binding domain-containing protein [Myxococcales bacterium]
MSEHEQTPPPEGANGAPQQGDKKEPKVIKRYTNRKLYDTVESRYVTLDEIAQMIKGGAEVKIIDNRSKEDLTSVTLAQIIFEEEKKRSQMPLGVLREIIRHGGEAVAGFYQEKAGTLVGKLDELKTKTENLRENLEERVRGVTGMFRTKTEEAQAAVKQAVDTGVSAAQAEVERLQKKVQELEQKLAEFTKRS